MTTKSDTQSGLNPDTNVPHRLRLGDVLGAIELTPGEISTFLGGLANQFLGGAHHNMGLSLRDHAAMVANPETYGYKVAEQAVTPGVEPYTPPTAPAYAETYGGGRVGDLTPARDTAPVTTPVTPEPDWKIAAERAGWRASETPSGASPGIASSEAEASRRDPIASFHTPDPA